MQHSKLRFCKIEIAMLIYDVAERLCPMIVSDMLLYTNHLRQ